MKTSVLNIKKINWVQCFIHLSLVASINAALFCSAKAAKNQLSYELPHQAIKIHDLAHNSKEKLSLLTYSKLHLGLKPPLKQNISKKIDKTKFNRYLKNPDILYISEFTSMNELNKNENIREIFKNNMKKWIVEISNFDRNIFNSEQKYLDNYLIPESNWDYSVNITSHKLNIEMARDLK